VLAHGNSARFGHFTTARSLSAPFAKAFNVLIVLAQHMHRVRTRFGHEDVSVWSDRQLHCVRDLVVHAVRDAHFLFFQNDLQNFRAILVRGIFFLKKDGV
jgi:hypothetical protein